MRIITIIHKINISFTIKYQTGSTKIVQRCQFLRRNIYYRRLLVHQNKIHCETFCHKFCEQA